MSQLYKDGTVADNFVGNGLMWLDTSTSPDTIRMTSTTYALPVQIISGGSGGTQYTEDAAHSSGATGTLALVVRQDTATQLAGADADYSVLITDANGRLHVLDANSAAIKTAVEVIDNFISGSRGLVTEDNSAAILTSVQLIDDSVATVASAITTKGLAAVGTDGTNARILKTDTGGELQVDVLSVAGTVAVTQSGTWDEVGINDSGNSITVDNGGTFVVQENGAALTALQLIDDGIATVASAITTKGMAAVGTDGTNARILKTDTGGELQIDVLTIAAGDNNIGNVDIVTVPTDPFGANADAGSSTGSISAKLRFIAATGIPITGTVTVGSHAVTNAGTFVVQVDGSALTALQLIDDPVFADDAAFTIATSKVTVMGGVAVETDGTDPTSVSAEADAAAIRLDRNRRVLVNSNHPNSWVVGEDHTTAQTNNQLKAAPGANLSLYITDIVMSNGATAGTIKLVEDEAGTPVTLGTTKYFAVNGGWSAHFVTPIRLTANKTLGFTSATVTTHTVEVHGYTAP